jgi:hypothetical protein
MPTILPTIRRAACLGAALLALPAGAFAQTGAPLYTGHAIPGIHGLESSSRPARGFSFENLSVYYTASKETDRHGKDTHNSGEVQHLSNHTTTTWLSPWRVFGANFAMSLRLALTNSEPNSRSLKADDGGGILGDVYVEPMALYWPGKKGIVSFRYGYWFDNGDFDWQSNSNAGKGFTSHQFALGWTYYPQKDRKWQYSIMNRFSIHEHVSGLDVRPGDDLVVDWNVGRHLSERLNVGLAGYGVFQTSRDQGADSNQDIGYYGSTALGGIARYSLPDLGGHAYVRLYHEFSTFNHTEGELLIFGLKFLL